ncbi:helix-turn-helix domain-containing protein, partial [Thiocapsa sp.]|uniref:helix-turn-helix domain-containing protein n=1 Tax=Thiocapsa sp. TaxID=2024551 RepID=UPI002CDDE64C
RINVIELRMPAMRERPRDIPALAERMLLRIARHHKGQPAMTLSADALEALMDYGFPGNVRELENILERATALCEGSVIEVGDLYLPQADGPVLPARAQIDDSVPLEDYLGEIEKKAILDALDETRWNRTAAAKKLGMTLRSLRYRLAKLGIE